jgi:hypothetical protein
MVQSSVSLSPKRLPVRFYRSDNGREPVMEWLKSLDAEDRGVIGEDIKDVEFSWPIGMPLVRPLGRDSVGSAKQPAGWTHSARDFLH